MSLIHEIQSQKPVVRYILFGGSVLAVLAVGGFYWLTGLQRDLFFALHEDPAERAVFVTQQERYTPKPLALITDQLGTLTASIGNLLGFDSSAGFDRGDAGDYTQDAPHLLSLSE